MIIRIVKTSSDIDSNSDYFYCGFFECNNRRYKNLLDHCNIDRKDLNLHKDFHKYSNNYYAFVIQPIEICCKNLIELSNTLNSKKIEISSKFSIDKNLHYSFAFDEMPIKILHNNFDYLCGHMVINPELGHLEFKYSAKIFSSSSIKSFIRLTTIFIVRFLSHLKFCLFNRLFNDININTETILICRTKSHYDLAKKLQRFIKSDNGIICTYSSIPISTNLEKGYSKISYLLIILKEYIKVFYRIWLYKRSVERELVIIDADLNIHKEYLDRILKKSHAAKNIISFEQKSPHAVVECSFNLNSIQVQTCDQVVEYLPFPIAGSHYLVDSEYTLSQIKSIFNDDRFKYLFSIKSSPIEELKYNKLNERIIVLATSPKRVEESNKIIKKFEEIGIKYRIKLHPRDNYSNYNIEKSLFIESIDKFQSFISFNSGLVTDLILADKYVILVRTKNNDNFDTPYYNKNLKQPFIINDLRHLESTIADFHESKHLSAQFNIDFKEKNSISNNFWRINDILN